MKSDTSQAGFTISRLFASAACILFFSGLPSRAQEVQECLGGVGFMSLGGQVTFQLPLGSIKANLPINLMFLPSVKSGFLPNSGWHLGLLEAETSDIDTQVVKVTTPTLQEFLLNRPSVEGSKLEADGVEDGYKDPVVTKMKLTDGSYYEFHNGGLTTFTYQGVPYEMASDPNGVRIYSNNSLVAQVVQDGDSVTITTPPDIYKLNLSDIEYPTVSGSTIFPKRIKTITSITKNDVPIYKVNYGFDPASLSQNIAVDAGPKHDEFAWSIADNSLLGHNGNTFKIQKTGTQLSDVAQYDPKNTLIEHYTFDWTSGLITHQDSTYSDTESLFLSGKLRGKKRWIERKDQKSDNKVMFSYDEGADLCRVAVRSGSNYLIDYDGGMLKTVTKDGQNIFEAASDGGKRVIKLKSWNGATATIAVGTDGLCQVLEATDKSLLGQTNLKEDDIVQYLKNQMPYCYLSKIKIDPAN